MEELLMLDEDLEYYPTTVEDTSDLPTSLIVTNVDSTIFSPGQNRTTFELLFKTFDEKASFQYFKSFKRARVNFNSPLSAAQARIRCHQMNVCGSMINCYFVQCDSPTKSSLADKHLQPPPPTKQFLISPPASPPVGWQPVSEAQPVINYDLLAAISALSPGEPHELHPSTESQPAIVVHICGDEREEISKPKLVIQQTKRPPNRSNSKGSEESSEESCVTPP